MKYAFFLNNNSELLCKSCGRKLTPKKMGKWYFAIGFFGAGLTGQLAFYLNRPVGEALFMSFCVAFLLYIGSVIYVYNQVEFQ